MTAIRPSFEVESSRLTAEILDQLEAVPAITVLDVGFGVSETLACFNDRRCRLIFCGLQEVLEKPLPSDEDPVQRQEQWRQRFRRAMDFPPGTRFDLCLFWDIFSYFDDNAVRAFAETLAPFVGTGTLGHGFALLKSDPNNTHREYGIVDREQLIVRPGRLGPFQDYPRPQARILKLLQHFTMSRSVLRRNGLLEMVLRGI